LPREKEIVVETHEVMDHKEINRLTDLLHERDKEILFLKSRPKEKEIVIEKVVDNNEINRLLGVIR
jgi:hypothetical protein